MKSGLCKTIGLFLTLVLHVAYSSAPSLNLNPFHELFDPQAEEQRIVSITGILHNEQDDSYGFHFAIYRQNQHYQAIASISDFVQNKVIWQNTTTISQEQFKEDGDHLGNFFWSFSPINSTLILGYSDQMNLKLDLLEPTRITPTSSLTKSLKIKQFWSGQINGHLITNEKEQFVTGQGAWLQQIWQNRFDQGHHAFQELLCKFDDGQSLVAVQIHEADALRAASVGRFNAQGKKENITQFLNFNLENKNKATVNLGKMNEEMKLEKLANLAHSDIFSVQILPEQTLGFCIYQTNPWHSLSQIAPQLANKSTSFFKKTLALTQKPFRIAINLKNKSTS
jgi:hypothetical protein